MLRLIIICLLGLTLLAPMVNAEEKPINIVSCRSATNTLLTADKDLVIFSYDAKGIDQDLNEDKFFANFTHQCLGTIRIIGGEVLARGYCKYMAPDGEFFIVNYDGIMGEKPLDWEYIYGSGKWKGVKGGGTAKYITKAKPIVKGTAQSCIQITGTYDVPQ